MSEPEREPDPPPPSPLAPVMRAAKAFLWPFMFSFALAFVGSRRELDWLLYAGLGGIALSMIGLFMWLVRAQG